MESFKINLDGTMIDGWTGFHYAALNGYTRILDFLQEHGANINTIDKFGRNALHWASRFDSPIVVKRLLVMGVDY